MLFLLKMSLSLNVCKLELNTGYADQKKDSITTQNDLHFTHFAQQIQARSQFQLGDIRSRSPFGLIEREQRYSKDH